jgi:hypothetical protein
MLDRRDLFKLPSLLAAPAPAPVTASVKNVLGKPTLHIRNQPVYAAFYALTDCPGGRWSYDEAPRKSMAAFVEAGFRLFQMDLFLADCMPSPSSFSVEPARRQIAGVLDLCPDAAVVIRWHLNAPDWWLQSHPGELTRYANGEFETIERTQPVRIIQDDLRRTPRASLASEAWMQFAVDRTAALLKGLRGTREGAALAGIQVASGVYGEWHYWGFMRNEPDISAPMQQRFAAWRRKAGKAEAQVPSLEERRALDDGIFRDPARREAVIDYYRCQQDLVAECILTLCRTVKRNWPRPILTGTFYGYFFSMFDRMATGGHLCLHKVLASPDVDYLSAPQAYGTSYRDPGGSGITRALIETIRLNGKLFLDEMDQTPSWKWLNNVDTAFQLADPAGDVSILRRNVLESYTRGAGLWYYDFGPANQSGWWLDRRLMTEIRRIHETLQRYHQRDYRPAGDVLFVFDTEVFYFTGSVQGTDPLTDPVAVNRTITEAWAAGAALETVHLRDLPRLDLARFRVVVFANTWLMTAANRRFVRETVLAPGRQVVFQGLPGYCDGARLDAAFSSEVTGLPLEKRDGLSYRPALAVKGEPVGLSRHGNVWFSSAPPIRMAEWREIFQQAGAHLYAPAGDIVHAGGGLVLVHSKTGGPRDIQFPSGRSSTLTMSANSSALFDAETGERLLG